MIKFEVLNRYGERFTPKEFIDEGLLNIDGNRVKENLVLLTGTTFIKDYNWTLLMSGVDESTNEFWYEKSMFDDTSSMLIDKMTPKVRRAFTSIFDITNEYLMDFTEKDIHRLNSIEGDIEDVVTEIMLVLNNTCYIEKTINIVKLFRFIAKINHTKSLDEKIKVVSGKYTSSKNGEYKIKLLGNGYHGLTLVVTDADTYKDTVHYIGSIISVDICVNTKAIESYQSIMLTRANFICNRFCGNEILKVSLVRWFTTIKKHYPELSYILGVDINKIDRYEDILTVYDVVVAMKLNLAFITSEDSGVRVLPMISKSDISYRDVESLIREYEFIDDGIMTANYSNPALLEDTKHIFDSIDYDKMEQIELYDDVARKLALRLVPRADLFCKVVK